MHLSMYCPTYPPTGKRWGLDLILADKYAPDQGDLINISTYWVKMYSPKVQ